MRKKKSYAENRENELRSSFTASGVLLIVVGFIFCALAVVSFMSDNIASALVILLIGAGVAAAGSVTLFNGYKNVKKKESNEQISGTEEYRKLMKRHDKVIEKRRKSSSKGNWSINRVLFEQRVYTGLLVCFIIIVFGLGVSYYLDTLVLFVIALIACVPVFICFLCGSGYKKLKRCAEENGIDFADAEEDFRDCVLFAFMGRSFGIGDKYTFILSNNIKEARIIENKNIAAIAISYQLVDNYTNGMYSGTTRNSFVTVCTAEGNLYRVNCGEFNEELIAEAYQRRLDCMHDGFEIVLPENAPPYIKESLSVTVPVKK